MCQTPHISHKWLIDCSLVLGIALASNVEAGANENNRAKHFTGVPNGWSISLSRGALAATSLTGQLPGADVIYNNSNWTGIYMQTDPGGTYIGRGYMSGPDFPTSPDAVVTPGCATQYQITGFAFGYCTDQPSIDVAVNFYNRRNLCGDGLPAIASYSLQGLPGSSSGAVECQIVTIDLRGIGGGQGPFALLAYGDGDWDGPPFSQDQFAWDISIQNVVGTSTGPLTAGDCNSTEYPRGVRWSLNGVDYSQLGNGIMSDNRIDYVPGHLCINMYPLATGLYLRLFADACGLLTGEPYCFGDGSGSACPCANSSPSLNKEGCRNSVNGVNGGRLEAIGTARLSADTVLLRTLRLPAVTSALFFQGTQRANGGAGVVLGDGLLCAGGGLIRLGTHVASNGQVEYPATGDPSVSTRGAVVMPGVRTYQTWYRNNAAYCTSSTFNLTNGWELSWSP